MMTTTTVTTCVFDAYGTLFDVAAYGSETAWVNRLDMPQDRLPGTPDHEFTDLPTLPSLIKR